MEKRLLEMARYTLLARERSLIRRRRSTLEDEQELRGALEPELEELAANRTAAEALQTLGEREHAALLRVQRALDRIERGTYGRCASCGGPIEPARLAALPEAERCALCSRGH
jgi:RNA polymerase-binding transcription factor DksA